MPASLYLRALKCLGPGFCKAISHPIKAYYWLCKYISGTSQVRLVNQFKRCRGGPFKILAARAHSLPNVGVSESSLASPWSDRVANPTLCSVSDLCTAGTRPRVWHSEMNLYLKKAHFSLLDTVLRARVQSIDWTQPVMDGDKMLQIPAWESCWKKLVSASDPLLSLSRWEEMVQADCSRNTPLMGTGSSLITFPEKHPLQGKACHVILTISHLKQAWS